jgi:tetratricopeptide (TPR) repeat protein
MARRSRRCAPRSKPKAFRSNDRTCFGWYNGAMNASVATTLQSALDLIRQGQAAMAEPLLAPLLQANPREPVALHLLGAVRAQQDRMTEAEALWRRSLEAKPDQLHVEFQLGQLLASNGRYDEAVALLRSVASARPDNMEAHVALARALAGLGDFAGAEGAYRRALTLDPQSPAAISGLGAVLNDLGRPGEAETVLRGAARDEGAVWRALIAHNLGVALEKQGRLPEALAQFDLALAHAPDHPRTQRNRAKTLERLGRHEEAVESYRRSLARDPTNAHAHEELNALLYRMGQDAAFLTSYDEALRRAPQAGALLLHKGAFLMRTERFAEARDCFAQAAAMAPDAAGPQAGLAAAYAGLGRTDLAIAANEKSLALRPNDAETKINLASTLIEAGDAKRALRLTDDVLALLPLDQGALAVREVALRACNDARAERLADYERHVRVFDLDPPAGFSSMEAFNIALNARLDALHTDRREHFDQTLRRGTQTNEPLFAGDDDLVRALRGRIEQAIAAYIAALAAEDADHPLAARRTGGFKFAGSWSSRLHDGGFHTNHIHPRGWISSCYYVEAPDAVADESARQGWIKFGEPCFKTTLGEPIRRAVKPAPGRLVLFPSYMWHGTIPFRAARARTTIAFDAVPA